MYNNNNYVQKIKTQNFIIIIIIIIRILNYYYYYSHKDCCELRNVAREAAHARVANIQFSLDDYYYSSSLFNYFFSSSTRRSTFVCCMCHNLLFQSARARSRNYLQNQLRFFLFVFYAIFVNTKLRLEYLNFECSRFRTLCVQFCFWALIAGITFFFAVQIKTASTIELVNAIVRTHSIRIRRICIDMLTAGERR